MTAGLPGAGTLLADFLRAARRRSAAAVALIVAGALLEGVGIMVLVPVVALILDLAGGTDAAAVAGPLFAWRGLESAASRIGIVLAAFAAILVLRFTVLLARDDLLARLQQDFVVELRARAFRQLARAPWAEVAGLRQGPVGHALTRDVDRAAGGVDAVIQGGVAAVMLAVQFALALALAPAVTLIAALLALALFRALRPIRERAARRGQDLTHSDLALFESVGGFLRGLKPAKAHGLEGRYVAAVEAAARRIAAAHRAFDLDHVLARLVLQTAAGGIGIVAVLLGLFAFGTRPENLIVALVILARLYTPLQAIQNSAQLVRHAAEGYRTARVLAGSADGGSVAEVGPAERLAAPPEIALGGVTVRGGDPGAAPILDRVSALLPAGSVTALIGESGAGKSTLCDVVVGLIAPDSGTVSLDGAPLDEALARRLRASVAYVGQEPFLFEDSLRNNLAWGCGPVADDAIWRALAAVGADRLARGLGGGLDGAIRADGGRFSGGERQRLRLARALLRRPRLLVLDEATNALDAEAEQAVLGAVLGARDGATVVMVSHRAAMLGLADRAIVLAGGRLIEAGPLAELARAPFGRVAAALAAGGPA